MDAIFEISTLENPHIPNFIKIGQLLVFGHFLGDQSPPKNLSFLVKKVRTKILMLFLDLAPSKGTRNRLTVESDHN